MLSVASDYVCSSFGFISVSPNEKCDVNGIWWPTICIKTTLID